MIPSNEQAREMLWRFVSVGGRPGYTRRELAALANINPSNMSRFLRGDAGMNLRTWVAVVSAMRSTEMVQMPGDVSEGDLARSMELCMTSKSLSINGFSAMSGVGTSQVRRLLFDKSDCVLQLETAARIDAAIRKLMGDATP